MQRLKLVFVLILLIAAGSEAFGQKAKLAKARQMMADLDYLGAISVYNSILESNEDSEATINIAECYRKIGDTPNSEYWYSQVVRLPEVQPLHKLYYGQALQANGHCDMAAEWFDQFVKEVPGDVRGQFLDRACDYEDELLTKNAGIYEIKHLNFNSSYDDFSPGYYKDGIVFASERDRGSSTKRIHSWTGYPFTDLYYVDAKQVEGEVCGNFVYGRSEKFSDKLNAKFHEAAVAFSQNEDRIYFTRNNYANGKVGKSDDGIIKLKIFEADLEGETWGDLKDLPFNSDEYSVAHPTLSLDGSKLYYASDMPGGFGGMDLYVSEKESDTWGPPINLGPQVNTEGNEVFPHLLGNDKLFFASDGHIGLGGLDNYMITDKGDGEWTLPENLGSPINTTHDDFGIIFNQEGTCGYFTSDRTGGNGRDDIYSFKKIAAPVQIFVYDAATGEGIADASVLNDCTGNTIITNAEGKAYLDMKLDECCTFAASKETYADNEKEACTRDINAGSQVFVEIPLHLAQLFQLDGIAFDANTGLPLEGVLVTLENDCSADPQSVMTDASGQYSFMLDKDCCYNVKGAKADYLTDTEADMCTKGLTETKTFMANLNLTPTKGQVVESDNQFVNDPVTGQWIDKDTGLPANGPGANGMNFKDGVLYMNDQVVETDQTWERSPTDYGVDQPIAYLLHIYYDFDQASIRNEGVPELEKLYAMMVENPDIIVEIASHTDARGSNAYNQRLSQRRANAVVEWMVSRGISASRIIPAGYGESQMVNDCVNRKPCSEEEHQLNRRTEFRVIGCKGQQQEIYSQPKDHPEVDGCVGCPF